MPIITSKFSSLFLLKRNLFYVDCAIPCEFIKLDYELRDIFGILDSSTVASSAVLDLLQFQSGSLIYFNLDADKIGRAHV